MWHCAKPNKSNLAFLWALGCENFDLALLAFLDKFGLKDLTLALILFLAFFGFFQQEGRNGRYMTYTYVSRLIDFFQCLRALDVLQCTGVSVSQFTSNISRQFGPSQASDAFV